MSLTGQVRHTRGSGSVAVQVEIVPCRRETHRALFIIQKRHVACQSRKYRERPNSLRRWALVLARALRLWVVQRIPNAKAKFERYGQKQPFSSVGASNSSDSRLKRFSQKNRVLAVNKPECQPIGTVVA
jgi:hypothetical protein